MDELLANEDNFIKCKGIPSNLINLAFILRKYTMDKIKI